MTTESAASSSEISKLVHMETVGTWADTPDFADDLGFGSWALQKLDDTTNVALLLGVFELALSVDSLGWSVVRVRSSFDLVTITAELGLIAVTSAISVTSMGAVRGSTI